MLRQRRGAGGCARDDGGDRWSFPGRAARVRQAAPRAARHGLGPLTLTPLALSGQRCLLAARLGMRYGQHVGRGCASVPGSSGLEPSGLEPLRSGALGLEHVALGAGRVHMTPTRGAQVAAGNCMRKRMRAKHCLLVGILLLG